MGSRASTFAALLSRSAEIAVDADVVSTSSHITTPSAPIVLGFETAEVLEMAEHQLDDIAAPAGDLVVAVGCLRDRIWRGSLP